MMWLVRPSTIVSVPVFVNTVVVFLLVVRWYILALQSNIYDGRQFSVALVLSIRDDVRWLKEMVDCLASDQHGDQGGQDSIASTAGNSSAQVTKSYGYVEKIIRDIQAGNITKLNVTIDGSVVTPGETIDVKLLSAKPLITLGPNNTDDVIVIILVLRSLQGTAYLAWMGELEASGVPRSACYKDTIQFDSIGGAIDGTQLLRYFGDEYITGMRLSVCEELCKTYNNLVGGVEDGTDCWCGNTIPAEYFRTERSKCNMQCAGCPKQTCGALKMLQMTMPDAVNLKWPNFLYTSPEDEKHRVAIIALKRPTGTADEKVRQILDPPYNREWTTLHKDAAGLDVASATFFYATSG